jgi:hypothetical protein
MEVALRRRLAGVDHVSISQREQSATVTFVPGTRAFSAAAFRAATAEAEVEVISFEVRVCGVVGQDGALYLDAEGDAPLIRLRGNVRTGSSVCVTGRLDDRHHPYVVELETAQPRS